MIAEQKVLEALLLLECSPGDSEQDVKASYRQLVKVWHPDRFESDAKLKQRATERMKLLNEAFQILEVAFAEKKQQEAFKSQPAKQNFRSDIRAPRKDRDEAEK